MKSPIKRPLGITLFALPILWIGCFGTLVFPVFIFTGGINQAWELMTSSFIHSHALSLVGACIFGVLWYGAYVLYAFMGIGLWRLRLWAWKIAVVVQWLGIGMSVVMAICMLLFFKQWAVSLGAGVWCSGICALTLWYLKLPKTRWVFEANNAMLHGLEVPALPPQTRNAIGIRIGVAVAAGVAIIAIFVISLFVGVEKMFRSSGAYTAAMSNAQASPCAVAKIGSPITAKGSISGSISEGDHTGEADLEIPVQGSKATGTLHVEAVKTDGKWTFKSLTLFESDGQIQILPAPSPCQ